MRRIGVLMVVSENDPMAQPWVAAFRAAICVISSGELSSSDCRLAAKGTYYASARVLPIPAFCWTSLIHRGRAIRRFTM
jgi:hypothetical protein